MNHLQPANAPFYRPPHSTEEDAFHIRHKPNILKKSWAIQPIPNPTLHQNIGLGHPTYNEPTTSFVIVRYRCRCYCCCCRRRQAHPPYRHWTNILFHYVLLIFQVLNLQFLVFNLFLFLFEFLHMILLFIIINYDCLSLSLHYNYIFGFFKLSIFFFILCICIYCIFFIFDVSAITHYDFRYIFIKGFWVSLIFLISIKLLTLFFALPFLYFLFYLTLRHDMQV